MMIVFYRDPIDAILLEQQMNSHMRSYNDSTISQYFSQDAMSVVERAKHHLHMIHMPNSSAAFPDTMLPQMYQRQHFGNLNIGLWQTFWPQHLHSDVLSAMNIPKNESFQPIPTANRNTEKREKYIQKFKPYKLPSTSTEK